MPYIRRVPTPSENDPRRTVNLRPEEREERTRLIGQLHQLLYDRRKLEHELHELEEQGPQFMPNVTAQYRRSIARLTVRIKRLDGKIAAIERRPVDDTPTDEGEN